MQALEVAQEQRKTDVVVFLESVDKAETAVAEVTRMMLCKTDGSDKHDRWFWVSPGAPRTVSWGK